MKGIKIHILWCRTLLALTFIHLHITFGQSSELYRKYISKKNMIKDVKTLYKLLIHHPGITLYTDTVVLRNKIIQNYIQGIPDSMEMRDFRFLLKDILKEAHCGHTDAQLPSSYLLKFFKKSPSRIPFQCIASDSIAYITGIYKPEEKKLHFGDSILSINNIGIAQILRKATSYYTYDGYIEESARYYARNMFHALLQIYFNFPESYKLVRLKKGKTDTLVLSSIRSKFPLRYKIFHVPDTLKSFGKESSISWYIPNEPDEQWAYLKIKNFTGKYFHARLKHCLKKIQNNHKKYLILDLRNNGGGRILQAEKLLYTLTSGAQGYMFYKHKKNSIPYSYTFFSLPYRILHAGLIFYFKKTIRQDTIFYVRRKIKKIKKIHSFEKIYVLMNYGTFSVASFVSARLKNHVSSVLIGSESGGTASGCNAVSILPCRLPISKMKIYLPVFRFCNSVLIMPDNGRGVQPDIFIRPDPSFLFRKEDPYISYLLKNIIKK